MRVLLIRNLIVKNGLAYKDLKIRRSKHILPACEKLQRAHFTGRHDTNYRTPLQVSPDWLVKQLEVKAKHLSVLEVTWSTDKETDARLEFVKNHIPGAVYLDIFKGAKNTEFLPRNVPDLVDFEDSLQEVGVNNDSHVVVYDREGKWGFYAGARAAWQMKLYGKDQVSVLNGGLQMWQSLGYPLTSDITEVKRGNFQATHHRELMSTFEDVESSLGKVQLVDGRPPEQYIYKSIKGAVNVPYSACFREGTLKSTEQLKQLFEEKHLDLTAPIVTFCNLGNLASTTALALKEAGASHVSVYYGSMTEWNSRADPAQIESG